jgi:isopentenyl-diphosphate delta-isomerase
MKKTRTSSRKEQHVAITIGQNVSFRKKTSGFEQFDFVHNALPELDCSEIDLTSNFLGKPVALPLIVSSMTGGYKDALRINRGLANVCEELHIGMGVGSQRQAIEDATYHKTFRVIRDVAPNIPLFGNIGAAEIAGLTDASPILRLAEMIRADGFAIHLNPLQEFLQPEGTPKFKGVLRAIEMIVRALSIPVIVKEIGAGISGDVASRLLDAGVRIVDVAGAGGTSWAGVELLRRGKAQKLDAEHLPGSAFWDWGISTVDALRQVVEVRARSPRLRIIASGGIAGGIDAAKAIALGADWVGAARPFLHALELGKEQQLKAEIERWALELRGAMFLTGSRTLIDLRRRRLVPKSKETLTA